MRMQLLSLVGVGVLSWMVQATPIPVRVFASADHMSEHAAHIFHTEALAADEAGYPLVVVVPTGGTPEGMYAKLTALYKKGVLPLDHVSLVNMDEYMGLGRVDFNSYRSYMDLHLIRNLFGFRQLDQWHIAQSAAEDRDAEALRMRRKFDGLRRQPHVRVVVFAGIGTNPAHIAFNDFQNVRAWEQDWQPPLSETEKTQLALQSTFRLVTLAEGTRRANARYFGGDVGAVPRQAITIGFQEILGADRIVVLATGASKVEPLFQTFSVSEPTYRVPASLLRTQSEKVEFLLDSLAYGVGAEGESLLQHQQDSEFQQRFRMDDPRTSIPLSTLADSSQVALVETRIGEVIEGVKYANLPTGKRILLITQSHLPHPSLVELLRKNQNLVDSTSCNDLEGEEDLEGLWFRNVRERKPYDILLLPDTLSIRLPISWWETQGGDAPLLIRYETPVSSSKIVVPFKAGWLEKKKKALQYHHSQIARTPYDLIVEATGELGRCWKSVGEAAELYTLEAVGEEARGTSSGEEELFTLLRSSQIIAVGPHPDDVELGMGGLLRALAEEGLPVTVINATTGYRAEMDKADFRPYLASYDAVRRERIEALPAGKITDTVTKKWIRATESEAAIHSLHKDAVVIHADLPFYKAPDYKLTEEDLVGVAEIVPMPVSRPVCFFLSHPLDQHPAHRATTTLFVEYAKRLRKQGVEVHVVYYETPWTGNWNLFQYVEGSGNRLAALVGLEQLAGKGHKSVDPERVASKTAERYRVERMQQKE